MSRTRTKYTPEEIRHQDRCIARLNKLLKAKRIRDTRDALKVPDLEATDRNPTVHSRPESDTI